ncbi:hypothetical protein CCHR01_05812 [Colletotrichum chrysophilum]|uniref:DUF7908 domain-containing protein n=1 Tax=Colletotrichum chrysophilum TaxID=1836956 RepID=A0AAD9ANG7_9PEZI|nr:hypothetical protein CCHR01_05812 [Colletotrichum chrysophilum]
MARLLRVAAILGVVATVGAAPPANDVERLWCFTYLSTYLEPVSFGTTIIPGNSTASPAQSSLYSAPMTVSASTVASTGSEILATSAESEGTSSALLTSALIPGSSIPTESIQTSASISVTAAGGTSFSNVPSTTVASSGVSGSFAITTSPPVPTTSVIPGDRVIFLIAPAPPERTKRIRKRDLGGFISTGLDENPPTCDLASVFILSDAQELFIGGIPLYYDVGDSFRQLRSTVSPPAGAVTRGFTTVNGLLVFRNPALPNGEASFCQDATSGQVYIVFTSGPSGCVLVNIVTYGDKLSH